MLLKREFTATSYVLQEDKTLLIFHRKMNKWLPPGGHLEPNELPHEGAIREVLEETGLHVEILPQENLWIKEPNASSLPRPYLCLLEEIPPYKDTPAHQHVDFIYLSKPIGGEENRCTRQTADMRWFTWEDLALLTPTELFDETRNALKKILQ